MLAFLYLVCYIDKASIGRCAMAFSILLNLTLTPTGNAKIEGMLPDLNMSGTQYNIALGIFFVPYVLFGMTAPSVRFLAYSINKTLATRGSQQHSTCQIQKAVSLFIDFDASVGYRRDPNGGCKELFRTVCGSRAPWYFRVRPTFCYFERLLSDLFADPDSSQAPCGLLPSGISHMKSKAG
jgi:hypothetical protein